MFSEKDFDEMARHYENCIQLSPKAQSSLLKNYSLDEELRKIRRDEIVSSDFEDLDDQTYTTYAKLLLSNFLSAASVAVDLHFTGLLREKTERLDERMSNTLEKESFAKSQDLINSFSARITYFEELPNILDECSSTQCIQKLKLYSNSMINFAGALTGYSSLNLEIDNEFAMAVLREAIPHFMNSRNPIHHLAAIILEKFLLIFENEMQGSEFWLCLGDKIAAFDIYNSLNHSKIASQESWVNELSDSAGKALIRKEKVVAPKKMVFARRVVLENCSVWNFSAAVGYSHGRCSDEYGTEYKITIYSIGATAGFNLLGEKLVIDHGSNIGNAVGTWYGASAGFALFPAVKVAYFANRKSRVRMAHFGAGASVNLDAVKLIIRRAK